MARSYSARRAMNSAYCSLSRYCSGMSNWARTAVFAGLSSAALKASCALLKTRLGLTDLGTV